MSCYEIQTLGPILLDDGQVKIIHMGQIMDNRIDSMAHGDLKPHAHNFSDVSLADEHCPQNVGGENCQKIPKYDFHVRSKSMFQRAYNSDFTAVTEPS